MISWGLTTWEADSVGCDLVGVDFVRVDLVGLTLTCCIASYSMIKQKKRKPGIEARVNAETQTRCTDHYLILYPSLIYSPSCPVSPVATLRVHDSPSPV